MTITELLDEVRNCYLKQFVSATAGLRSRGGEIVFEPAIRNQDGGLAREKALMLPTRADAVLIRNGEILETLLVEPKQQVDFDSLSFEWSGGLEVTLNAFQWDACKVRAVDVALSSDRAPLKTWFNKWFDVDETHGPDPQGFLGVVHDISDPVTTDRELTFWVDLGSSTVEAFEEMLDAIRNIGASAIEIGEQRQAN